LDVPVVSGERLTLIGPTREPSRQLPPPILFARKHAGAAQWLKLAAFRGVSLPLQMLWHLPQGDAGCVGLKVRGIRDALTDSPLPLEELGLRAGSAR